MIGYHKLKKVGHDHYYQAVVTCVLNDIKDYEIKQHKDKKFYIKKK